jgi:adenylosuccinate lyase
MIERYSLPQMKHIWDDENKFRIMLNIEVFACEAQAKLGVIPRKSLSNIQKKAGFNIRRINEIEKKTQHDIVAFVANIAQNIGPDAKYLHIGMTSSDLLDTTLGVQLKEASEILEDDLKRLLKVLAAKAKKYKDTVCVGRTHGIHAEPTSFGLKLALWYDETQRSLKRLRDAKEAIAVGKLSGAIGTYANINPNIELYVCKKLGLKPANIATQVIQRDIYAQYLATLAIIGATLEQFATEIRHLQKTEVLEAEEPFGKGQKGSSAMPHKRNPVICERICGLSRLLRSNSMAAMENVALWHERDISHSSVERVIIPDSTIALDYMLNKFIYVAEGLLVYPENMMANLIRTKGLIFSQRVLLELMERGLPRMKAYDFVQRCAMRSWRERLDFKILLLQDTDVPKYLTKKDLDRIFNLDYYLRHVDRIFRKTGL